MADFIFVRRPGSSTIRVMVERRRLGARRCAARAMAMAGWPEHAIARALRITRQAVASAISGSTLWDGTAVAAFREVA